MTTTEQRERVVAAATKASEISWTIDEYGTVLTPDGRTAELNGFATICGYGEAQKASKERARSVVEIVTLFPSLLAALEEAEASAREQFATAKANADACGALRQSNDRLKQAVDGYRQVAAQDRHRAETAEQALSAQQQENERLREALETIAIGEGFLKLTTDDAEATSYNEGVDLAHSLAARAKRALQAPQSQGGEDHVG